MTQPPITPNYQPQPAGSQSGVATGAFVLGIVAICVAAILFCFPYLGMLLGIIAIILGVIAMSQGPAGSRTASKGRMGLILGIIAVVIGIGWIMAIRAGVSFLQKKGGQWQQQIQQKADEMQKQAEEQQRKAEEELKKQQNSTSQPGAAAPNVMPWRVASAVGNAGPRVLLVTLS